MKNEEYNLYKKAAMGILPAPEATRKQIVREAKEEKKLRKKSAWFIPALACACVAIVICTAVPPVRAAITQWFRENFSIQNYVSQPEGERPKTPELESLIEQAKPDPEEVAEPNSIEIVEIDPQWQAWADSLHPSVGDPYYDGATLIVPFDMGGGASELLGAATVSPDGGELQAPVEIWFGSSSDPVEINGKNYIASCGAHVSESEYHKYSGYIDEETGAYTEERARKIAQADSVLCAATIGIGSRMEAPEGWESLSEEERGLWRDSAVAAQDGTQPKPPELKGLQQVTAYFPIIMTDYSQPIQEEDGISYQGVRIGKMKLSFSFNANELKDNTQTVEIGKTVTFKGQGTYRWSDWESDPEVASFVNKTVDMSGVTMTAKKMEIKPSGARLYVAITCPDNWDERDKQCFVSSITPKTYGDGMELYSSGEQYGLEEDGEDLGMCITLNMLPSELQAIDTFEIVPVLARYAGYDDVPYEEGVLTKIPQDEIQGWQEESTELKDCTLKFSIK